ncbi:MAG: sensor histidine kinase [Microthrixaceae bacterium]
MPYATRHRVTLTCRREEDHAWVSVADDGDGVADADAARLFDPYVSGDRGGDTQRLGLGLAIVRELATALGAHVSVHGHGVLGGLEVVVTLPIPAESRVRA